MTDERRHHSRITFHTLATLARKTTPGAASPANTDPINVLVLDLSLKGALLTVPAETRLTVGEHCTLSVQLDTDDLIRMECKVAHHEGERTGLLCLTIDIDSVTHLRRLVELNLGDPELLERELSALIAD